MASGLLARDTLNVLPGGHGHKASAAPSMVDVCTDWCRNDLCAASGAVRGALAVRIVAVRELVSVVVQAVAAVLLEGLGRASVIGRAGVVHLLADLAAGGQHPEEQGGEEEAGQETQVLNGRMFAART